MRYADAGSVLFKETSLGGRVNIRRVTPLGQRQSTRLAWPETAARADGRDADVNYARLIDAEGPWREWATSNDVYIVTRRWRLRGDALA